MQHKSWHRSLGFLRVAASSNNKICKHSPEFVSSLSFINGNVCLNAQTMSNKN